jgi:hypothetical protein
VQQKHPTTCNQLQEKQEQQDASDDSERWEGESEEESLSTFDHPRAFHSVEKGGTMEYTREDGSIGKILLPIHAAETAEDVLKLSYWIQFTSRAHDHKQNGNYYQCCIHTAIMAIATVVVLLFLFNRMMNVISMMDNFDSNSISTQEATVLIAFIQHVTTVAQCEQQTQTRAFFYYQWQWPFFLRRIAKDFILWQIIRYGWWYGMSTTPLDWPTFSALT